MEVIKPLWSKKVIDGDKEKDEVILIYNIKRVQHEMLHKDPKLEPYFVSPMNFLYETTFVDFFMYNTDTQSSLTKCLTTYSITLAICLISFQSLNICSFLLLFPSCCSSKQQNKCRIIELNI